MAKRPISEDASWRNPRASERELEIRVLGRATAVDPEVRLRRVVRRLEERHGAPGAAGAGRGHGAPRVQIEVHPGDAEARRGLRRRQVDVPEGRAMCLVVRAGHNGNGNHANGRPRRSAWRDRLVVAGTDLEPEPLAALAGEGADVGIVTTGDELDALLERRVEAWMRAVADPSTARPGACRWRQGGARAVETTWPVLVVEGAVLAGGAFLGLAAINALLWAGGADVQLPGFRFDFMSRDTVPLRAPILVGGHLALLVAVAWLAGFRCGGRRSVGSRVQVAARAALLVPAVTTAWFTWRFFEDGVIYGTHDHQLQARGWRMLFAFEAWSVVGTDRFRFMRPALHNFSETIAPFWQPWAILLLGGASFAATARLAMGLLPPGVAAPRGRGGRLPEAVGRGVEAGQSVSASSFPGSRQT